jgi:hypothetical protein
MTKYEFLNDIEEIKTDKLFIGETLDNLNEEIRNNCWAISMSEEIADEFTVDELKSFLKDVKADRKQQLRNGKSNVELIYYVWYDEQAGQLRFNFINSMHRQLPLSAPLTFVSDEGEILSDYLSRVQTEITTVKVYKELIIG